MQSLLIQDHKTFMHHLLAAETFDSFELVKAQISTFCTFSIDGSYHHGYFQEEDASVSDAPYCAWRMVRPHVLEMIRGKSKPRNMHIVFRLSDANTQKVLRSGASSGAASLSAEDVNGLYLNISYNHTESEEQIACVTGTSLKVFSTDKSLEHSWDDMVIRFFRKNQIPFSVS